MIYCNSGTTVVAAAGPLKRVKTALMQHFFNQFPVGLMVNLLLKSRVVDLLSREVGRKFFIFKAS